MRASVQETSRSQQLSDPSLRWNLSWTVFGNVIFYASNWAVVVVLAKLGSTELVGLYALGMAITQPIIAFARLELRSVQVTDVNAQFAFRYYLGLRLLAVVTANAIIVFAVVNYWNQSAVAVVIALAGLVNSVDAVSDIFYGQLQRQEKMDQIAVAMSLKGTGSLLTLWFTLWSSGSLVWGLTAMLVVRFLVLALYEIPCISRLMQDYRKASRKIAFKEDAQASDLRVLGRLAWLAVPMGTVVMLNSYSANIPRYFIADYYGDRELGIFAASSSLIMVGRLVVGSLGQSASPRLARYYSTGNVSAFRSLLLKLMAIGALIGVLGCIAGLLFGKTILRIVYRPEYATTIEVFLFLSVAETFYYVVMFLGVGMTSARHFYLQVPLSLLSVVTTTVSSYLLIPRFGLIGAGLSIVVTMVAMLIGHLGVFPLVFRNVPGDRSQALVN